MYKDKYVYAIVLAAGKGTRMGFDKMLYNIDGESVVKKSVKAFENNRYVDKIIVAAGDNTESVKQEVSCFKKVICVVKGGKERADSVANALEFTDNEGIAAIHDGARPFVSDEIISRTIEKAYIYKCAVPCVPVKDTIKYSEGDSVDKTLPRDKLYITQTPQVFYIEDYKKLLLRGKNSLVTDDAQLFEKAGYKVYITQGSYENYKITTPEDLRKEKNMRIGHGYDVHRFAPDRKLILGGVEIEFEMGLLGHSDADVLTHAVMDALLGALALGDIGKHFPDTDEKYKGADSLLLLKCVKELIKQKGAQVENIDCTILCQKPKLAPHIQSMRKNIADVLEIDMDKVSVKATTEEGLGFTGAMEGIAVHSVCLVNL